MFPVELDNHKHWKTDTNGKGKSIVQNKLGEFGNRKVKDANKLKWNEALQLAMKPFIIMSRIQGYICPRGVFSYLLLCCPRVKII